MSNLKTLLNQAEAAEYLGKSANWLAKSRLGHWPGPPYVKIGRNVRYRLSDLEAWVAAHVIECA